MSRGYFITAAGTELGKTLFTAGLTHQMRQIGRPVFAIKPVISGFDAASLACSDTGLLLEAQGRSVTLQEADVISPWRFRAPVSPHLAALEEGNAPSAEEIRDFCRRALGRSELALIEGAGGVQSPLVQGYTQADLLEELGIPAILLGGSYLGSISHTLCAAEAMLARGIPIAAIVLSESATSPTSLADTQQAVQTHLRKPVPVFTLPRVSPKTNTAHWQQLPPLTGMISDEA